MTTLQDYYKGCAKQDGFGRRCGLVFESWKNGMTKEIEQEVRYYCPTCQAKILGYKQARQEELEFLKSWDADGLIEQATKERSHYYVASRGTLIKERIKQIKEELSGGKE